MLIVYALTVQLAKYGYTIYITSLQKPESTLIEHFVTQGVNIFLRERISSSVMTREVVSQFLYDLMALTQQVFGLRKLLIISISTRMFTKYYAYVRTGRKTANFLHYSKIHHCMICRFNCSSHRTTFKDIFVYICYLSVKKSSSSYGMSFYIRLSCKQLRLFLHTYTKIV